VPTIFTQVPAIWMSTNG